MKRLRRPNRDSEYLPEVRAPAEYLDFLHIAATTRSVACIDWPFTVSECGYGRFSAKMDAHRYVCTIVHGRPPSDKHEVAHECGLRTCVNPAHLSWKTHYDNVQDSVRHGRIVSGEKHASAKVSDEDAAKIAGSPLPAETIAKQYGISIAQARRLKRGLRRAITERMPVTVYPSFDRWIGPHWAVRRSEGQRVSRRFTAKDVAVAYASALGVPVTILTEPES